MGRPRRPQQEIDSILRSHQLSGQSLLAFARDRGLCYATLLRWRRRPGGSQPPAASSPPSFIPIEVEPSDAGGEFVLSWAPHRWLRIPPGFDPAQLRQLLDLLGVRP